MGLRRSGADADAGRAGESLVERLRASDRLVVSERRRGRALTGLGLVAEHGLVGRRVDRSVDLDAEIDLRPAAASDDLANTLNYAALHRRLVRIVSTTSYALLERLAGRLLDEVFADNRVARAELTVSKPEILAGATPSVTLARDNPRHEPAE